MLSNDANIVFFRYGLFICIINSQKILIFQELALYGEFTIRETLLYFGRIHGMQKKSIENQIEFLLDLLELSNFTDEFVRNLR